MAKKVKKKELGKGIRALLSGMDNSNEVSPPEEQVQVVRELSSSVAMISIDHIEVNPFQPRNEFDETALKELSESLKIHGLIQPITVRRMAKDQYQLISGERRFRASKLAGLKEIPAYIRIANDQEMLEMALVENIQREQLNPMEIAFTYQRLIDECELTHEKLSGRVGKERSSVSNYIRLLKLIPAGQQALKNKEISMGHAKAILGLDDPSLQIRVLNETLEGKLSVRATEALVKKFTQPAANSAKNTKSLPQDYLDLRKKLTDQFEAKVDFKLKKKDKGTIQIHFNSLDDLNRILTQFEE